MTATVIKMPKFQTKSTQEIDLPLLPAGDHRMVVKRAAFATIKTGQYAGRTVINLGLEAKGFRWVWKQLPMWDMTSDSSSDERKWFEMSTQAFFEALEYDSDELDPEWLLDEEVLAVVGLQARADKPELSQNYIVTFKKFTFSSEQ